MAERDNAKSSSRSTSAAAGADWMDPARLRARRAPGRYPGAAKNLEYLGFPFPREWSPHGRRLEAPRELEGDHPRRDPRSG